MNNSDQKFFENKIVSPEQMAIIFGVCKKTVYQWIKDGKLPSRKIGNRIFLHLPTIERLIEGG